MAFAAGEAREGGDESPGEGRDDGDRRASGLALDERRHRQRGERDDQALQREGAGEHGQRDPEAVADLGCERHDGARLELVHDVEQVERDQRVERHPVVPQHLPERRRLLDARDAHGCATAVAQLLVLDQDVGHDSPST